MKRETFYQCLKCGNIVIKVNDGGGTLACCGEPMSIIEPNTSGAAPEKHLPVATREGDTLKVTVGEVEHPMAEDHYIKWIYLVTEEGVLAKCLKPGDAPAATFALDGQTPVSVYAYCNKHGLWKTEL